MTNRIAVQRLHRHGLTHRPFASAEAVVAWLGAVQAQDFHGAKWSLGLRMQQATDQGIEQAFNEGQILRTHMMRPTWHFVTPADLRWIMQLTAPRVHAVNAYMYRKLELDDAVLAQSHKVIIKALQSEQYLTREELGAHLNAAGISADGMRLGYIVHHAELALIVCSGPRKGKQFSYALVDDRAPQPPRFMGDEALAELTRRFFTGHAPAMIEDFAWWSGLTKADVRKGLEILRSELFSEVIDGKVYWFSPDVELSSQSPAGMLLPFFDEYTIAYKDHTVFLAAEHAEQAQTMLLGGSIVVNGQVLGSWRRTFTRKETLIELACFRSMTAPELEVIDAAVKQFGDFVGRSARWNLLP